MEWRLIISGVGRGEWNMALDEALWHSFRKVGRPTLRLYRWAELTLSLGRFQRVETVDLEECARRKIEVVRRPSGGRAVLHGFEVTYSLVHPLERLGNVTKSHRQIAEALVVGLRKIGLAAELIDVKRSPQNLSGACFAAPTRFELTVAGRKVAGSAQVRDRLALLEHGSLPLELDLERMAAVLQSDDLSQEQLEELLRRQAAGLRDFAPRLRAEEVEEALIAGFAERFGANFVEVEDNPTAEELALAKELAERKYSNPKWTFRR